MTDYIKNQFITYKVAKQLKEMGFDEPCIALFIDSTLFIKDIDYLESQEQAEYIFGEWIIKNHTKSNNKKIYLAPMWQQVTDWFYKYHKLSINLHRQNIGILYVEKLNTEIYKTDNINAYERTILKACQLINKG